MPDSRRRRLPRAAIFSALAVAWGAVASGDVVVMKNGAVYRGTVDKDVPIVQIFDGLKRVVVRESKVAKIDESDAPEKLEQFLPQQPLEVHAGKMPVYAINIEATPWDDSGRRTFRYQGPGSKKTVAMTQGIIALNPSTIRYRGVDGFWQGQGMTSQVPRASVLAILGKVDQANEEYRLRVIRFLIQAAWYPEVKAELDRLAKDFPGLKDRAASVRQTVLELEARGLFNEIEVRRKAGQPKEVRARLAAFPVDGIAGAMQVAVRDALRRDEIQATSDKSLADAVRKAADVQPSDVRTAWKGRLLEVLKGMNEAPDAVRDRLDAFRSAEANPKATDEAKFALAMSGWVVGSDAAKSDLASADALWKSRDLVQGFLGGNQEDGTPTSDALLAFELADKKQIDFDLLTRIVRLAPPPLADGSVKPLQPKFLRIRDDPVPEQPTEYTILLPPEYHPLRSYPAIVALHCSGAETPAQRTRSAADWWGAEAARRGYIVIAPEYAMRGQAIDYRYSASEAAAVVLALRDARRRFAIDSDRVFLGGSLLGANMAWDFGLGHPDLFAGVSIINGLPAKYVWAYKDSNAKRVPFHIAMGDLAPTESQLIFEKCGKALIEAGCDITYTEYYGRGLEDLPEEIPAIFDWMDRRNKRDPMPKTFEVKTARTSDDRFYGVVIRQFSNGRSVDPDAVSPLGENIKKPATVSANVNNVLNRFDVSTFGVSQADLWVPIGPIDFSKKVEVRLNNKMLFKGLPKADFSPFLQDLRVRGDRKQLYGLKVSTGAGTAK